MFPLAHYKTVLNIRMFVQAHYNKVANIRRFCLFVCLRVCLCFIKKAVNIRRSSLTHYEKVMNIRRFSLSLPTSDEYSNVSASPVKQSGEYSKVFAFRLQKTS